MAENNKLKPWQGWALFGGAMVAVFGLGLLCSSLMHRDGEVASIFNNRKVKMDKEIESRNDLFESDFPLEYETWLATADSSFNSEFCGQKKVDVLEERPDMVILWAGYAFSWDYTTPRGHMHAIDDMRETLRTFAPMTEADKQQPGTCWTCKSPDVPRLMAEVGEENFYSAPWSKWGDQVMNPIGCSDCHDPATMDLHISRPALKNAYAAMGKDITKATHQEMRSLVCAQCHVEYYFAGDKKVATFPWEKGMTLEAAEAYYDSIGFTDYTHALSKAPILKAQHPGYEMSLQGIHGQRGVSCADCHMPYKSEGGVKFSDHKVMSPLANIDRTCQVCHREDAETLRANVYERQRKCTEIRNKTEHELAVAHIEAKFAWDKGATDAEMQEALQYLRKGQWRWDYAVASHGASFHAPQEVTRLLADGLDYAHKARFAIARVLAKHGYTDAVPMPDITTKEKAQKYIGLDMAQKNADKKKFLDTVVPTWVKTAVAKGRLKAES